MEKELMRLKKIVDEALGKYFVDDAPQDELFEAMRYSLLSGGKRIRAVLTLVFCEMCGGSEDDAISFACGVEMLHAYSLIHDDLPCMDNDDLRRGKPTNHKVYGECIATLAGDALQAAAFHTVLTAPLSDDKVRKAATELAFAAGEKGICGGQYLDMAAEGRDLFVDEIATIHSMKTASMIKAAVKMGVIAGGGTKEQLDAAGEYAEAIGLAFQVRDDVLDCTSDEETLGKPVGSDIESEKSTFVSALGIEECEKIIYKATEKAKKAVSGAFTDTSFALWLADYLAGRKN